MAEERVCIDCGKDISHRGNRSIRCVECQLEYSKKLDAERMRMYRKGYDLKSKFGLGDAIEGDFVMTCRAKEHEVRLGNTVYSYKTVLDEKTPADYSARQSYGFPVYEEKEHLLVDLVFNEVKAIFFKISSLRSC